ncbi:MAG: hypothetical protein HW383_648 [Candidatus Magasanikbacteria bacterium]|nr:hypothetical protein [Candidatus Magasanikbacteria bacterium]
MKEAPEPDKKRPLVFTPEEIKLLHLPETDPVLLELMQKKGITLNQGDVEIEVNGERLWLDTMAGDFGTITYAYQHNERPEANRRRVNLHALTKKIGGKIFEELDKTEGRFKSAKRK